MGTRREGKRFGIEASVTRGRQMTLRLLRLLRHFFKALGRTWEEPWSAFGTKAASWADLLLKSERNGDYRDALTNSLPSCSLIALLLSSLSLDGMPMVRLCPVRKDEKQAL